MLKKYLKTGLCYAILIWLDALFKDFKDFRGNSYSPAHCPGVWEILNRIQGYRDTGIHGYRDTRIQRYKDTRIQGYKDTGIKGYSDTGRQGYRIQRIYGKRIGIQIY